MLKGIEWKERTRIFMQMIHPRIHAFNRLTIRKAGEESRDHSLSLVCKGDVRSQVDALICRGLESMNG